MIESELFGYTRGAFTGAVSPKLGKIERADTGTLFLDKVGEFSADMQVKLLRMLQNGELDKIGATGTTVVNVRVIAATNRNLQAMIDRWCLSRRSVISPRRSSARTAAVG